MWSPQRQSGTTKIIGPAYTVKYVAVEDPEAAHPTHYVSSCPLHSPLPTALEVLEDGFDGWLNGQTDRLDPAWRRNLYLLPTRNPECCLRRLDVSASSCQRRRGDRCRWEVSGFGGAEGAGVSGKLGFLKSHSIAKPYLRAKCRSLREMSAPRRRMARSKSRLLTFR